MTHQSPLYVHVSPLFFFFFSFSAGRIDHGHHAGSAIRALTDTVALNKAVAGAIKTVNKGNIWFNRPFSKMAVENSNKSKF